ncbi:MAG: hypothetical protein V1660_01235 [archaeon]
MNELRRRGVVLERRGTREIENDSLRRQKIAGPEISRTNSVHDGAAITYSDFRDEREIWREPISHRSEIKKYKNITRFIN